MFTTRVDDSRSPDSSVRPPEYRTKSAVIMVVKASVTHPGFFAAIKKYLLLPGKAATTDAEFRQTAEFKALVPTSNSNIVAKEAPSHSSDISVSFSHRQYEIALSVPLTFVY